MIAFIDDNRDTYGIEPICCGLPTAPSSYHGRSSRRQDPARLSARARQHAALKPEIARVFAGKLCCLRRAQGLAADDTGRFSGRLLYGHAVDAREGLGSVIRSKPVPTTISDKAAPCSLDHINRRFYAPAPNMLWVSDFTYVATWAGFVYVAFVIDTYACLIVRWRASKTAHAGFVLDTLEQALHAHRPVHRCGLVHHSDRGSINYTERLDEGGIEPSVGSVGDSYGNPLAETINGLYEAEVIYQRGLWRSLDAVEYVIYGLKDALVRRCRCRVWNGELGV